MSELKDSGNVLPDIEYIGFVLGAKTDKIVKTDGSVSYALKLRLGSMIDQSLGWVDGNKVWIDHHMWLTPAAQAGTQKRIADAFEIPIAKQDREFFADPNKALYKKDCRFTTEAETYRNVTRIKVKWVNNINPPKRSEVVDMSDSDFDVILSRVAPSVDQPSDNFGGPELF